MCGACVGKINYGIIGLGMMGREHIQNINLLDGAGVIALSDPNQEQRKISLELVKNAQVYTDYKDLLKDTNVDVLVISSPNYTHAGILLDILRNDSRPVLVEKPLCTTSDMCKNILDVAYKYTSPVWVAMEYRYMEAISQLLERVKRGIVGNRKMISIREHRFPFLKKVADWNRFNKNTGGTLVEKCCHFFDLMRLLAEDEVMSVYATGAADVNFLEERYNDEIPDIIDNAFILLDFWSGKRAMLELCMFCDGSYFQEEITVLGDKGKIACMIPGPDRLWAVNNLDELGCFTGFSGKHRNSEIIFSPRNPKCPIHEEIKPNEVLQLTGDHLGSTFYQHQKFNNVIQGKGHVEVTIEDGIKAVMIGIAAEESIKTHKVVEIEKI